MQEIKADLKSIKNDVTAIRLDVAKNTISLDTHIKRTDLLEKLVLGVVLVILGAIVKLLFS